MAQPSVSVRKPKLILCDIEGTTTAITFVKDVLFPYVRENLRSYLEKNWESAGTKADINLLWQQYLTDQNLDAKVPTLEDFSKEELSKGDKDKMINSIVQYVFWQMDDDKKNTALKQLQGNIWLDGYQHGLLKAHVYDEVPRKFQEWTSNNISLAIYSSGSVLAQKLLFGYTSFGDLTKYLSDYFDTKVGAKQTVESYQTISNNLNLPASEILFLTDIVNEARAATSAGMNSLILIREGNAELSTDEKRDFKHIDTFDQLVFDQA